MSTYTPPTWVNDRPPFVNAEAMQNLTDVAAAMQARTVEVKLNMGLGFPSTNREALNDTSEKKIKSIEMIPFMSFDSLEEKKRLDKLSYIFTASGSQFSGFPSVGVEEEVISTYNTNGDYFVWYFESGESYYLNAKGNGATTTLTASNLDDIFGTYGTISAPCVSINNLGIGVAVGFASAYGTSVGAYTLNGGLTWTELENIADLGIVKSVYVNDEGEGTFFGETSMYFNSYGFLLDDFSGYHDETYFRNPFPNTPDWDIENCTPLAMCEQFGIVFENNKKKYSYTTNCGFQWHEVDFPSAWAGDDIYSPMMFKFSGDIESMCVVFATTPDLHDFIAARLDYLSSRSLTDFHYYGDAVSWGWVKNKSSFIIPQYRHQYSSGGSFSFPLIKSILNGTIYKNPTSWVVNDYPQSIAMNDEGEIMILQGNVSSPRAVKYLLQNPVAPLGELVTGQVTP